MGNYWGWIKNNYKWYDWKYVENKVKVKLGPFYTIEEAQEAATVGATCSETTSTPGSGQRPGARTSLRLRR